MKKKIKSLFFLLFLGIGILSAQTQVRGIVVDESGEPVIGSSVQIKGTGQGTVTDLDGIFTLNVPKDAEILVVSYVGMKTQEVEVAPNLHIILEADTELLDEVIVVGYGTAPTSLFPSINNHS